MSSPSSALDTSCRIAYNILLNIRDAIADFKIPSQSLSYTDLNCAYIEIGENLTNESYKAYIEIAMKMINRVLLIEHAYNNAKKLVRERDITYLDVMYEMLRIAFSAVCERALNVERYNVFREKYDRITAMIQSTDAASKNIALIQYFNTFLKYFEENTSLPFVQKYYKNVVYIILNKIVQHSQQHPDTAFMSEVRTALVHLVRLSNNPSQYYHYYTNNFLPLYQRFIENYYQSNDTSASS